MPLILPKSIFIHIPKTGGITARAAIRNAFQNRKVEPLESGDESMDWISERLHGGYSDLSESEKAGRPNVMATVRETLSWYESLWCHKLRHPDDGIGITASDFWSDDFEAWILRCAAERPGAYGWTICRQLAGCEKPNILRFDWMMPDLVTAMTEAGEEFNSLDIYAQPPINIGGEERERCRWSDRMIEAIRESEGSGRYPTAFEQRYGSRCIGEPYGRVVGDAAVTK